MSALDTMPSRAIYENGGWKDGRVGQAYDLICAVLGDRGESHFRHSLTTALEAFDEQKELAA